MSVQIVQNPTIFSVICLFEFNHGNYSISYNVKQVHLPPALLYMAEQKSLHRYSFHISSTAIYGRTKSLHHYSFHISFCLLCHRHIFCYLALYWCKLAQNRCILYVEVLLTKLVSWSLNNVIRFWIRKDGYAHIQVLDIIFMQAFCKVTTHMYQELFGLETI